MSSLKDSLCANCSLTKKATYSTYSFVSDRNGITNRAFYLNNSYLILRLLYW